MPSHCRHDIYEESLHNFLERSRQVTQCATCWVQSSAHTQVLDLTKDTYSLSATNSITKRQIDTLSAFINI